MKKSLFTIEYNSIGHWLLRLLGTLLVIVALVSIATKASNGLISSATLALTYMIAAMALNLLLGFTGQISIGHSAFFGIGAYATGIAVSRWEWNPWITFPFAFVVAFIVGVLVSFPASRIKGIYLALVTLALALVFPQFLRWEKVRWLTGGSTGLPLKDSPIQTTGFNIGRGENQIRNYEIFGWNPFGDLRSLDGQTPFYFWIAVLITVIVYLVCRGIVKSRAGRTMIAVRDNETAAAVMGVNLVATKAFVFGISAGLCALAGSVTAIRIGKVTPDLLSLTIFGAIVFLVIVVVGGAGSLWGPILGAAIYVAIIDRTGTWSNDDAIPALIRPLFAWSKNAPGDGLFAIALIVLMFVAPYGLVGLWRQHSVRIVRVLPKMAGTAALIIETSDTVIGQNDDADSSAPA